MSYPKSHASHDARVSPVSQSHIAGAQTGTIHAPWTQLRPKHASGSQSPLSGM